MQILALQLKGFIISGIQITHASNEYDIKDREIRSMNIAKRELSCDRLTVITSDLEVEREGIRFIPLWKWLLK